MPDDIINASHGDVDRLRKAVYKSGSNDPDQGRLTGINPMKTNLNIEIKVDIARIIYALAGLTLILASIYQNLLL